MEKYIAYIATADGMEAENGAQELLCPTFQEAKDTVAKHLLAEEFEPGIDKLTGTWEIEKRVMSRDEICAAGTDAVILLNVGAFQRAPE